MAIVAPIRPSVESEQVVLAAVILTSDGLDKVRAILAPDDLTGAHATIYRAVLELVANDKPLDLVSVTNALRDAGKLEQVGGTPYLAQLLDEAPAVANIEHHAQTVRDVAFRRRARRQFEKATAGLAQSPGNLVEFLTEQREQLDGLITSHAGGSAGLTTAGAEQIFAPLPRLQYLLGALDMCPGAPVLVAGYGFSGKTLALQSAALSVAGGTKVWDAFAAERGPVLHVDYEQGSRLTFERYQRLAYDLQLGPSDINDYLRVATMPTTYLDQPGGAEALKRAADGCRMVIIDSLRACAPSIDENSSEVRRILDALGRLSETTGATVVVVHHARKPQREAVGGAKASIRGSGAIFDACGSVVVFEGTKGEPVRVSHEKARTSGVLKDDFELVIEDVPDERNPRRGLRVTARAAGPRPDLDDTRGPKGIDRLKPAIIELLKKTQFSSKSAIVEALGANRNASFAAIDMLLSEGVIRENRSGAQRRFQVCK